MKILQIKELAVPEIKVIRFARFHDQRGYFTEQYRNSDLLKESGVRSLTNAAFVQANESYSRPNVVRGLHFQWQPYMGKLVRTIHGHMVDIVLDIRKGSPTFGKAIMYDMPADPQSEFDEWIWVPPGFAHGNFFLQETKIEYFCTGEYSPNCEAGISPTATDIDWTLCDPAMMIHFDEIMLTALITDKDLQAQNLQTWASGDDSNNFVYSDLQQAGLNE